MGGRSGREEAGEEAGEEAVTVEEDDVEGEYVEDVHQEGDDEEDRREERYEEDGEEEDIRALLARRRRREPDPRRHQMAGHSKWANIKHRKVRQDAVKGKLWSKCSRAIIVAAKAGGGDPDMNLTLRYAIDEAKAANMAKDTIEKAIKKGAGAAGDGESYDEIRYEGYGPNGVAVIVDCLTDNVNRTAPRDAQDLREGGRQSRQAGSGVVRFLEPRPHPRRR